MTVLSVVGIQGDVIHAVSGLQELMRDLVCGGVAVSHFPATACCPAVLGGYSGIILFAIGAKRNFWHGALIRGPDTAWIVAEPRRHLGGGTNSFPTLRPVYTESKLGRGAMLRACLILGMAVSVWATPITGDFGFSANSNFADIIGPGFAWQFHQDAPPVVYTQCPAVTCASPSIFAFLEGEVGQGDSVPAPVTSALAGIGMLLLIWLSAKRRLSTTPPPSPRTPGLSRGSRPN
jgi:hypothetical protein